MLRGQKGITLIALVITVIVLLILAGVAISMLTGGEGDNVYQGAKSASSVYSASASDEAYKVSTIMSDYSYVSNQLSQGA